MDADVIIVGAGLSGLTCAVELRRRGFEPLLIEAADAVGGRVRTDVVDGFLLDRGFQVLLTSYPNARAFLDISALQLGKFSPGAWLGMADGSGGGHLVADPLRQPLELAATLRAPIGNLADKFLILKMRRMLRKRGPDRIQEWTQISARDWLKAFGFSEKIIGQFFKPFFRGILLEEQLASEAWLLATLYHYFSTGYAALPAGGMQAIPRQLAQQIGDESILLNSTVAKVGSNKVHLADSRTYSARRIVIACDQTAGRKLNTIEDTVAFNGCGCHYFVARENPLARANLLWLNASGKGAVAQIVTPAGAQPAYAPPGHCLISVGTTGDQAVSKPALLAELRTYFGAVVDDWQALADYWIQRALPKREPSKTQRSFASYRLVEGRYLCGDHLSYGSIDGAIASGAATARALATDFANGQKTSPETSATT
jgi:phytoene dehydrogenase-like protein